MNTVELGSRIHLQTGLRIEATNEVNTGYLVINDANGNYVSTTPVIWQRLLYRSDAECATSLQHRPKFGYPRCVWAWDFPARSVRSCAL